MTLTEQQIDAIMKEREAFAARVARENANIVACERILGRALSNSELNSVCLMVIKMDRRSR